MTFEMDVFISYAHIDNLPLREGESGWIASFHKALEVRLAQLLGEKPRIWRDQKLQGNDFFGDEIVKQFPSKLFHYHFAFYISRYSLFFSKSIKSVSRSVFIPELFIGNKSLIL